MGEVVPIDVRAFRRGDREQLTDLVNAHVAAVVPGVSVSVNTVMSQLEREPGEYVVDPWVTQRRALVAVERDAVAAGALLLRYGAHEKVGENYRDAGEIRWLVARPSTPAAADHLLTACCDVFDEWEVSKRYADGALPAFTTYGVPACWPHIRSAYTRAGFRSGGRIEIILVAPVDDLPRDHRCLIDGVTLARSVGDCGTRLSAMRDGRCIGYIEVETDVTAGGTRSRLAGWADIGNLHVVEDLRRRGMGTWLVAQAASWLRLGRAERLVAYASPEHTDELAFLHAVGFHELTRTERVWERAARGHTRSRTTARAMPS
jgi:GNAT superfamily N-acetyltransferase